MTPLKYADVIADLLVALGYTHCYFVAGGNIMHLLDAVRTRLRCVPFVHEVGAAIAAEYHNATLPPGQGKAFCLVTAGPGLTNAITGIAGAWQESRELLVLGGQVKRSDLARGAVRQRGIQEVDGVALVSSLTKHAVRLETAWEPERLAALIRDGATPRKGPVFIEVPIDVQGMPYTPRGAESLAPGEPSSDLPQPARHELEALAAMVAASRRPLLLIGGGVTAGPALTRMLEVAQELDLPVMTTWNGADRVPSDHPCYFGRPNTWGMRYANYLTGVCDLLVAVGTRLGLQQTGFNWEAFCPEARIVHIDLDRAELDKGHPRTDLRLQADAQAVLEALSDDLPRRLSAAWFAPWADYCRFVKATLPLSEAINEAPSGFVNPYEFYGQLSHVAKENAIFVPCSSGSSFTCSYQALLLRGPQRMISNKSQASMGYGLAGSIGAALANPQATVYLVEGDGGFSQNLQELATVSRHDLDIKIFLWINQGYASIRMTQRNYFGGAWLGCDEASGLAFPDWPALFRSFSIPYFAMEGSGFETAGLAAFMASNRFCAIGVPLHPEQTFYPKIASRVRPDGSMESLPLHEIGPALPSELDRELASHPFRGVTCAQETP